MSRAVATFMLIVTETVINYLYQRNGIEGKELVAYKGGHVEKDLLNALWIPNINLEPFG